MKNYITGMRRRIEASSPYLAAQEKKAPFPNPYALTIESARGKLITALSRLKTASDWLSKASVPSPGRPHVPPPLEYQHKSVHRDLVGALVYLYFREFLQTRTDPVLYAYQRLIAKVAEIPFIHWSVSELSDVEEALSKDPQFRRLTDLGGQLGKALDTYLPHQYRLAAARNTSLTQFDQIYIQARLTLRRMLLPGRRYH